MVVLREPVGALRNLSVDAPDFFRLFRAGLGDVMSLAEGSGGGDGGVELFVERIHGMSGVDDEKDSAYGGFLGRHRCRC